MTPHNLLFPVVVDASPRAYALPVARNRSRNCSRFGAGSFFRSRFTFERTSHACRPMLVHSSLSSSSMPQAAHADVCERQMRKFKDELDRTKAKSWLGKALVSAAVAVAGEED